LAQGQTILHAIRYHLGWDTAHSQTSHLERETISRYARGRRLLAEIGVYEGKTTAALSRAMAPDGVLYAIDPYFPGRLGICWSKGIARREVAKALPAGRVVFLQQLSFRAVKAMPASLDFLFIDGDHSREGIRRDWIDWAPLISPGGFVALHDTHFSDEYPDSAEWESVRYFEEEIRYDPRFKLIEQVKLLSIMQRRETADPSG
jgi:predicted O-methyltransferase YrrM